MYECHFILYSILDLFWEEQVYLEKNFFLSFSNK